MQVFFAVFDVKPEVDQAERRSPSFTFPFLLNPLLAFRGLICVLAPDSDRHLLFLRNTDLKPASVKDALPFTK